ncbi:MAG: riboflavin synthase [Myxococcales bacterium]|nr:riboflavin synthase [Myxococcales bacterium]
MDGGMFTGLVETTGELRARERRGPGFRLEVACTLGPLELGDSIAVSGACLTVIAHDERGFSADVSLETAEKTTLGRLPLGARVNLERSLRVGDRLGGHLVSGHVDGVAKVRSVESVGEAWRVWVEPPAELARFVAPKGSVTLDGTSLTVNGLQGDAFDVMLIPHTREVTNLGRLAAGVELNMEVDLVARYVLRYLDASSADPDARLRDVLERAGFIRS